MAMDARDDPLRTSRSFVAVLTLSVSFPLAVSAQLSSIRAQSLQGEHPVLAAPQRLPQRPSIADAVGVTLGTLLGQTDTLDERGAPIGAFEILSQQGFLAALRHDGQVGHVDELHYERAACHGSPVVTVSSATRKQQVLPGSVFGFGNPAQLYVVPQSARPIRQTARSVLRAGVTGYDCFEVGDTVTVYPVERNDAAMTGVRDARGPLNIALAPRAAPLPEASATSDHDDRGQASHAEAECAAGCAYRQLGDGVCQPECNVRQCTHDQGDCSPQQVERARQAVDARCADECRDEDLSDGFCDAACNQAACRFDDGDCQ